MPMHFLLGREEASVERVEELIKRVDSAIVVNLLEYWWRVSYPGPDGINPSATLALIQISIIT
jgi:hypothetical protein